MTPKNAPAPAPVPRTALAAGWSLLAICALHTLAFAIHPYWDDWLAGPFRSTAPAADEAAQFWGLPGGFVVPGALLGLTLLRQARHGIRVPAWVGGVLGAWSLTCSWMVGPSGFLLVLAPAVLLLVGGRKGGGLKGGGRKGAARSVSPRGSRPARRTSRA